MSNGERERTNALSGRMKETPRTPPPGPSARRAGVAMCVGSLASIGAMLIGQNQPGYWLRELAGGGRRLRGFDLFIHDHYFVIDPELLLINFIAFALVAYAFLWSARQRSAHR